MLTTFRYNSLGNIPIFFYPTTIMLVDDDEDFLKLLADKLADNYATVVFSNPDKAIDYLKDRAVTFFRDQYVFGQGEKSILGFRNEIYNAERFKDVIISVLDYDMPDKTGFDVKWDMGSMDYEKHRQYHSYILLTGKQPSAFNEKNLTDSVAKKFISKWDPHYVEQLLTGINDLSAKIFQEVCYGWAASLCHDPAEQTSFMFDGNFLPILNDYLKKYGICEGYLFDRQGSLLFLDKKANPSWLFVRNDQGMKNSIALAKKYQAPASVIAALTEKKVILSLYEKEDFESRKTIDWDNYLLPGMVFADANKQREVFNHRPSNYYYAFGDFPEHGIKRDKILSYADFLDHANKV